MVKNRASGFRFGIGWGKRRGGVHWEALGEDGRMSRGLAAIRARQKQSLLWRKRMIETLYRGGFPDYWGPFVCPSFFVSPPDMIDPIHFDVIVLLRHVSILSKIGARKYTWDELGKSLMAQRVKAKSAVGAGPDLQLTPWQAVKRDVFRVLATDDPEFIEIRKRIAGSGSPSTFSVLSTLSLWLAGSRGISTSLTTPIIGTLLYGIATSSMGYAAMV